MNQSIHQILQQVSAQEILKKKRFPAEAILEALAEEFPGYVSNVRGKGLFTAFDLPSGTERDAVMSALYDNGAIVLGSGDRSLRFRPHLTITREEIDLLYDLLAKSVRSCLA